MHLRNTDFCRHAFALCKGRGLEIGALHKPFDLDADVIYLDRFGTEALKKSYAGDPRVSEIKPVQLVSKDGNYYPFIDSGAFDFVISSHVLEHTTNPGRVIEEWLRIVRPGGIAYMIFPDKNFCFDRRRAVTTTEHLMDDFHNKIEVTDIEHYRDFIYNSEGEDGIKRNPTEEFVERCWKGQTSIHVHTFTFESAQAFMKELAKELKFEIAVGLTQGLHIHFGLRKAAEPA